ncbi:MAG: NAD(P)-binding domain-containing protein, partial [Bacteroidia bacterium]
MNVCIIGAGRVAWSLVPALQHAGVAVRQLITRNLSHGKNFAEAYRIPVVSEKPSELLAGLDLVVMTLPDGVIEETVSRFLEKSPQSGTLPILVHTSGSVSI